MILDEIANYAKIRVQDDKKVRNLDEMKRQAIESKKGDFCFEKALNKSDIQTICEVKKASPSKGIIAEEFDHIQVALEYEVAGATCISVLTEPKYFLGKDNYLSEIRRVVNIPLLRKDFIIDEYQIYQAKVMGADCILLICALLSLEQIKNYLSICDELGLSVLVETHDEEEIKRAVLAGARMIGVNNRNLKTFEVDIHNSEKLRKFVPKDIIFIAESGIHSNKEIQILRKAGVNAVLIGESLMKSRDKKAALEELLKL